MNDDTINISISDLGREEIVLRRIFEDAMIQVRAYPHLEPELFDKRENSLLVKAIHKYQSIYKKFPTTQELGAILPDGAVKNQLIRIANSDVSKVGKKVSLDLVDSFFREKKTMKILTETAEAVHNRAWDGISDTIKSLQNAVNFTMHMNTGLSLHKDVAEALKRLNERMVAIPSSIPGVNANTSSSLGLAGGGWYRKSLSLFMGQPNVGKTILLANEAAYAYQCGYNVLYITLELAEELIWERICVNVSDISLKDIRSKKSEEVESLLRERKELNANECGNLWVRKMPSSATVIDFQSIIDEIWQTHGIKIDLLVVDYLGIMKPAKRSYSLKDQTLYTAGKECAEQLRDLADANELAVLSASQMTRGGYNTTDVGMQHIAGSAGINDTADFMVTIVTDPTLKEMGMYLHFILKNRFGPNNMSFMTRLDIDKMRVRGPSDSDLDNYSSLSSANNISTKIDMKESAKTRKKVSEKDVKPPNLTDVYEFGDKSINLEIKDYASHI